VSGFENAERIGETTLNRALSALIALLAPMSLAAQDDQVEQISQRIAQKIQLGFEQSGSPIRQMLTDTGLSAADSDRVAKEFLEGTLACVLDAARSEAVEKSLPFESVLLEIEQAIDDREDDKLTIIDSDRIDEKANSCGFNEMQKAGISVELLIKQSAKSAERVSRDQ